MLGQVNIEPHFLNPVELGLQPIAGFLRLLQDPVKEFLGAEIAFVMAKPDMFFQSVDVLLFYLVLALELFFTVCSPKYS